MTLPNLKQMSIVTNTGIYRCQCIQTNFFLYFFTHVLHWKDTSKLYTSVNYIFQSV